MLWSLILCIRSMLSSHTASIGWVALVDPDLVSVGFFCFIPLLKDSVGASVNKTGCECLCEWVLHTGAFQHKHECAQEEMLLSWSIDRRHDETAWGNSFQRYCGCITNAQYEILRDAELYRVSALHAISIFIWFYLYIPFHGGCHIIKV